MPFRSIIQRYQWATSFVIDSVYRLISHKRLVDYRAFNKKLEILAMRTSVAREKKSNFSRFRSRALRSGIQTMTLVDFQQKSSHL